MNNPFIKNGAVSLNTSINKLIIRKMPIDKVKQDLEGKAAIDIFSTELFIEEIKIRSEMLRLDLNCIDEKKLPQYLNQCLESNNVIVKDTANDIIKLFGERLAIILLTLKKGENINRLGRKDWDDSNWEYWNQLKNVILVGGLSSERLGEKLKFYIEEVFKDSNEEGYNIILSKDSSNVGIKGCSTYIDGDQEKSYLIFDCGHTFIKRSLVKMCNKEIINIIRLDKVSSRHVVCDIDNDQEKKNEAIELHKYLLNIIIDTVNDANSKIELERSRKYKTKAGEYLGNESIGNQIVISIANYVNNGLFVNRGGYGKLRLIADNYEKYLSDELYKSIGKRFNITFVHDGTAMAAAFSDYPNSVCISLGTSFGVGFPIDKNC
ncbi:hypothetical protein [Inconstantimicrobium mannanitabidum]|uniref:Uncharacterized protein n=1 Tax=Inconstantimicrobium mannanitabidum TaxID=1604901 RepID=A0ACB5REE3_9CLOT|nr:hypothetical protein [Clostridium sp. TW13]GKX67495.1 hypothetical protein rsdtw13_27530 [Clostridium sp. TW13]